MTRMATVRKPTIEISLDLAEAAALRKLLGSLSGTEKQRLDPHGLTGDLFEKLTEELEAVS